VRDVLTFSRAANAPSEISEVVLDEIVAELKVELELTINESAAVIATSELPILRGDRSAIEQLLRNLIVNAIKFRRLDMAPHILASARTAPNGDCVLSLKDNGQGFPIPPDRTIFEPFVRMHADSGIEGAGLGLAICKSVCDRHGWTISVSSQAGEGSEFSIAVPASAVVEAPPNQ
jgi:signal transduction histidine kinase